MWISSSSLFFLFSLLPYVTPKVKILVSSDQPVVIGSNITFTVKLHRPEQPHYDVSWTELCYRTLRNHQAVLDQSNNYTSNWTLWYPEADTPSVSFVNPGTYTVSATVTYTYLFLTMNVGTALSDFNVTMNFTGRLDPTQPGVVVLKKDPHFITTANETTLVANVHDPYNYIGRAENVTWSWYNSTSFIANTTVPTLKQNITKEGNYYYNVTLAAIYNNTAKNSTEDDKITRWGVYESTVVAKVPISNFTVKGDLWFPHGRLLNARIVCEGSQPYTYCVQLINGPYNMTGNETCPTLEVTNVCDIPVVRYFNEPGTASLLVIVENDISRLINRTLINVYKVSKQQPLSIIIVPLTCTLIALVMIIFGIAYVWESRARYTVEVADFDFGHAGDDELPYMTFLERLKDALSTSSNSRQRLYNSTDDEQFVGTRRASQFS